MPLYVTGVIVAFFEPIVHAWSNIIDSKFSNEVFPRLSILIFFGAILSLIYLPVIIFISPPHMLPLRLLGIVGIIALIEIAYLFPYYWSLKSTDTSIVAALFSLGEAFIPVMAYFFLRERLSVLQYLGFAIIIVSSIALTIDFKKLKLNAAFFMMFATSLILAVEVILFKYVFSQGASWSSVVVPETLFQVLIAISLAFFAGWQAIKDGFSKLVKIKGLFVVNEFFGTVDNLSGSFALFALPTSVAKAIGGTQPAFVLAYAYIFREKHSAFFKEKIDRREIFRKIFFFLLTILGTILVIG